MMERPDKLIRPDTSRDYRTLLFLVPPTLIGDRSKYRVAKQRVEYDGLEQMVKAARYQLAERYLSQDVPPYPEDLELIAVMSGDASVKLQEPPGWVWAYELPQMIGRVYCSIAGHNWDRVVGTTTVYRQYRCNRCGRFGKAPRRT